MKFSPDLLVPMNGEIYCHVIENELVGLDRNLFWSTSISFEPILIAGEKCCCSLCCEWVQWPIRSWRDLDGCKSVFNYREHGFEASLYLHIHHPAKKTELLITRIEDNKFLASVSMNVEIPSNAGLEIEGNLLIETESHVFFSGLLIVPENLDIDSNDISEIKRVANEFADLTSFEQPERYEYGYIFRPKKCSSKM